MRSGVRLRATERGSATVGSERPSRERVERFRATYEENYLPLLGYALRRSPTPEDAADVVAETFLVLWRRYDAAPRAEEIRPWLYGIARNVIANKQRTARRQQRLRARLDAEAIRPQGSGSGSASDVVSQALEELSPKDRELLRLVTWEELSIRELSVSLGCSVNAAKIRLHRARRRLAHQLELRGISLKRSDRTGHVRVERPMTIANEEDFS